MELVFAFATNNDEYLSNDHYGMAKYYYVYKISKGKEKFVEKRKNTDYKEDKSLKHGDPQKAKATAFISKGVDALVGRKFGPNLPKILKRFVCVVVRTHTLHEAIVLLKNNGENRKHIILKPKSTSESL